VVIIKRKLLSSYEVYLSQSSNVLFSIGTPRGAGGGGGGGGAAAAPLPLKQILKNTDFVDMLISKVLCDLRFNLNQSLNSADE